MFQEIRYIKSHTGLCYSVVLAAILILLTGCRGGPLDLQERHQSSEEPPINYQEYEDIPFAEYLERTRVSIREHDELGRNENELLLISPFQTTSEGYEECEDSERIGVLLIHGLTDTPYLMRDIAQSLIDNNDCLVGRSIILPGHATAPGDLLDVSYYDWIDAADYGIKSFAAGGINNIFIAGFSTGGALALNYAIHSTTRDNESINLRGLLLFSPAIRIKTRGGFLANWHKLVSWASPARSWIDIAEDKDFAKYESFPKFAGDQIHLLTSRRIKPLDGSELSAPLFVVISRDDDTVNSEITEQFFENRADDRSRLIVYKRSALNEECNYSTSNTICERGSIFEEINVAGFSHTAIPVSPDNPHYGVGGSYKSCAHYLDQAEYNDCMSDDTERFVHGEKSLYKGESDKPVRRLTFNPDFGYMTAVMNEFVESNRYR